MKATIVNKLLFIFLIFLVILFFVQCRAFKQNKSITNTSLVLHGSFSYKSEQDNISQKCVLIISDENINIKILSDIGIVLGTVKVFNDSIYVSGLFSQKIVISDTSTILKNRGIKIKLDIIKGLILNNIDSSFISKCFTNNMNCYVTKNANFSEFDTKVDLYDLKNNNLISVFYKDKMKKRSIIVPKQIAIKLLNINLKIIVESLDVRSN